MSFHRIRSNDEYRAAYAESVRDPHAFWAAQAEHFTWRKKWEVAVYKTKTRKHDQQYSPQGIFLLEKMRYQLRYGLHYRFCFL